MSYNTIQDNLNMKNILRVNYYKIGVVLDLDCPQSHIIFDQVFVCWLYRQNIIVYFRKILSLSS